MLSRLLCCGALFALLSAPACVTEAEVAPTNGALSTGASGVSENAAAAFVVDLSDCADTCGSARSECQAGCDSQACQQKCTGAKQLCMDDCRSGFQSDIDELGADPDNPPTPHLCDCPEAELPVQCPGTMDCGACCLGGIIGGGGGVGKFCKCGEDWMNFCPEEQACVDCCFK